MKGVDAQQTTVEDVKERWAKQALLDVRDLARVTLRLAKCGAGKPSAAEEVAAVELDDPSLTLVDAGITGTTWLLADTAGACPRPRWPRRPRACLLRALSQLRRAVCVVRGRARRGGCRACCAARVRGGVAQLIQ